MIQWNVENGEKSGVVFQAIPHNYKGITPDIFIFVIDNVVDKTKVEAAIATGAKVMLFFNEFHDEENVRVHFSAWRYEKARISLPEQI